MVRPWGRRSAGLLCLALLGAQPAQAGYPLGGGLPKEQDIILSCSVDDAHLAKDCVSPVGPPGGALSKRELAFIQVEAAAPDYLVGATPGYRVLVMIRRSTAAPLDGANPGRAVAPTSSTPAPITDPDWALKPKSADMNGYFPERAQRMGVSGDATARCTLGPSGDLLGCWLMNQEPSDMSFGFALLRLSVLFQMKPMTKDGSPAAGRTYDLNARFDARSTNITLVNRP